MSEQSMAEMANDEDGAGEGAEIVSDEENLEGQDGEDGEGADGGNGSDAGGDKAVETLARIMGWKPESEWKGSPPPGGQVKSAADFVAGASRHQREMAEQIQSMSGRLSETQKTIKEMAEFHRKTAAAMYAKALKDVEAKERAAVEEGDTAAFEAAKAERKELGEPPKEPEKDGGKKDVDPAADETFKAWNAENDWYGKNVKLTIYADQAARILSSGPNGLRGRALYDAVTEEIKSEFPDKFGNPDRKRAPKVEGANNSGGGASKKGWADLPKEAKDAGARFIEQGFFDDPKKELTVEQKRAKYAHDYFMQEEN